MVYDASLKRKWDEFSIKETAFEEGFEKGKLEGADEKALAIARDLLKKGLPLELIADVTKLTPEQIQAL